MQPPKTLRSKGRLLELNQPLVMGIINATPDSFFEGSRNLISENALIHAEKMLADGADILDIGGQSTRPGATLVAQEEEISRVIPILKGIRNRFPDAWLSIDTFYAEVARQAVEEGADIINDISAGDFDANMLPLISEKKVIFVAMHKKGEPSNMQVNPSYLDVLDEIIRYFRSKKNQLESLGIYDWILDPGFGFGKSLEHNYTLIAGLNSLHLFDVPVLVGLSRKGMIQKLLGVTADTALNGTTAANMAALERGANILRVHDVLEARQCIDIFLKVQKSIPIFLHPQNPL
ncbi:MAG: dihydropteroate synthase [Bacteroidetes bacterium]|nr:dihydropteroate synthase [Bacteroidota bacterium]